MTVILLLFLIGVLFLAAEVLVPGAILGVAGGLLLFAGCVIAFVKYDTGGGLLAVAAAIIIAFVAFFIEFRVLPRTSIGKRAFLNREITAVSPPVGAEARDLIGKSAEALTMLSPTGYVLVDGRRYEAFCRSGQAPAGSRLEVTGADNFRIIVTRTTEPS